MIKIADFGISRKLAEITNTQKNILGMVPYIDPQNFKINNDNKNYEKSDVYSVGVLLWEISSGQKPFESYNDDFQRLTLMSEISNGKREIPVPDTPINYIDIYTGIIIIDFCSDLLMSTIISYFYNCFRMLER